MSIHDFKIRRDRILEYLKSKIGAPDRTSYAIMANEFNIRIDNVLRCLNRLEKDGLIVRKKMGRGQLRSQIDIPGHGTVHLDISPPPPRKDPAVERLKTMKTTVQTMVNGVTILPLTEPDEFGYSATVKSVETWLASSRPGDRAVYARGILVGRTKAGQRVQSAARSGLVLPCAKRRNGVMEWMIHRRKSLW